MILILPGSIDRLFLSSFLSHFGAPLLKRWKVQGMRDRSRGRRWEGRRDKSILENYAPQNTSSYSRPDSRPNERTALHTPSRLEVHWGMRDGGESDACLRWVFPSNGLFPFGRVRIFAFLHCRNFSWKYWVFFDELLEWFSFSFCDFKARVCDSFWCNFKSKLCEWLVKSLCISFV